jgi:hypothetical protein
MAAGGNSMPMHDWTRVGAWLYHDFHTLWLTAIRRTLNDGRMPQGFYALAEQTTRTMGPDVIALERREPKATRAPATDGTAVAVALRASAKPQTPAFRPKRVAIRHVTGDRVVAIIELVSPGNKDSRHAVRQFARKVVRAVHAGVHVLFVDPFPPRAADPQGMHNVVWPLLNGDPHQFPAETPLVAAGYEAVQPPNCYVTPFAVGRPLPDMPVFLEPDFLVTLPLEATYSAAFADVLPMHRELLEG